MSCSAVAEQAFFFLSEYDTILIEAVISQVSCDSQVRDYIVDEVYLIYYLCLLYRREA